MERGRLSSIFLLYIFFIKTTLSYETPLTLIPSNTTARNLRNSPLYYPPILEYHNTTVEEVEIFGVVEVYHSDDFQKGISKKHTLLRHPELNIIYNLKYVLSGGENGKRVVGRKRNLLTEQNAVTDEYEKLTIEPHELTTGMYIKAKGRINHQQGFEDIMDKQPFEIAEHDFVVSQFDVHTTEYEYKQKRAAEEEVDYNRVVFLLVNFGKYTVDCTRDYIQSHIVEGVDSWNDGILGLFARASLTTIAFSDNLKATGGIDVFGPYNIDYNEKTCAPDNWANQVDAAARDANVDLNRYQKRVYVLPAISSLYDACGWHGLGNVGCGLSCRAWIANCDKVEVYMHELGHNLGLLHAASNWYQLGKTVEYGDPTSVMGNMWWSSDAMDTRYYNAPEMIFLKAIRDDKVLSVEISGKYILGQLDSLPENIQDDVPQILKIEHPDTHDLYYFSFRHSPDVLFSDQILVHQYCNSSAPTYFLRNLQIGEYFEDNVHRFTVAVLYQDPITNYYVLDINFECIINPIHYQIQVTNLHSNYSLIDENIQIGSAGSDFTLTLEITNNDSPLCTPTSFSFENSVPPPGYKIEFSPQNLYLMPNQTCYLTVSMAKDTNDDESNNELTSSFTIAATADSEFWSSEHDWNFQGILTIADKCERNYPIVVVNERERMYDDVYLTYDVIVMNNDTLSCTSTGFSVDVNLPPYWSYVITPQFISMTSPQQITEFSLNLTPPTTPNTLTNTTQMLLTVELSKGLETSVTVVLLNTTRCQTNPPTLQQVDPTPIWMESRSARSTLLSITNNDVGLCSNRTFSIKMINVVSGDDVRINLFPNMVTLGPQEVGYVRAIIAAPIISSDTELFASLVVYDVAMTSSNNVEISANVSVPKCQINPIARAFNCPQMSKRELGYFICQAGFRDDDVWTCADFIIRMHVSIVDHSGEGWAVGFTNGNTFSLYTGNVTWLNVNISFPAATTPVGSYKFHLYGGELGNETLHSFSEYADVQIFSCIPDVTRVFWNSDSYQIASLGQSVSYVIAVQNRDSLYCDPVLYTVNVDLGEISENFEYRVSSQSVMVRQGSTGFVYVTFTPKKTAEAFIFPFNVTVFDPKNTTLHSGSLTAMLQADVNCTLVSPSVSITRDDVIIPFPGNASSASYTINITNNDIGNCEPTSFTLYFSATSDTSPLYRGVTLVRSSPTSFGDLVLSPNETITLSGIVQNEINSPPEDYMVTASLGDDKNDIHRAVARTVYSIGCPAPRPVTNLTASQFTPFLKTMTAVSLEWDACDSNLWCCCPCQWIVYRNGEMIGTSSDTNFTDLDRPADSDNKYTVVTKDRLGQLSPQQNVTCLAQVRVKVSPPDLMGLYIFIALVIGGFIWGIIFAVAIYMCVKKQKTAVKTEQVPLLDIQDTESDASDSADDVITTNTSKNSNSKNNNDVVDLATAMKGVIEVSRQDPTDRS